MGINFEEYFRLERMVKSVAKQLTLKTTELKALIYMGDNGFGIPLKRHPDLEGLTTEYNEKRGAMVVPKEIGLDSAGSTIPNLVRKKLVNKLGYFEDMRKCFLELTNEGINLYKEAKDKF
ncbi:MAG: hypothetical protein PVJ67_02245 [Candidatus Pacearchaeota archaeon]|jgi:hypothetical protein